MTKEIFLENADSWCSHRYLLWAALEATKDSKMPVVEFGSGWGSTPFLRQYCEDDNRPFISFDNNEEWAGKTGSIFIENWETADIYKEYSVCLVDEAPGENRHKTLAILKDKATILVVHDSEGSGYLLDKIYPLFKYRYDYKMFPAWATWLSNKVELTDEILNLGQ